MTRLDEWIESEVAAYERDFALTPEDRAKFEEHLRGSLFGRQLAASDAAGDLGDSVLAILKGHSDRLRDSALAKWFRDPR